MTEPRSPLSAETTNGQIEYATYGEGTPVLVVHGTPGGVDQSAALASFLPADRFKVVLVSRRGYLGTPLAEQTDIDSEAELLAALLDELGVEKTGVVCWSGGGPATYRLAALHPERVSKIVALDAVSKKFEFEDMSFPDRLVMATSPGEWLLRVMAAHMPKSLIGSTLAEEGALSKDQLKERVAEVFADDAKRRFVLDLSVTATRGGERKAGFDNDAANFAAIDSLELERVTCPVLLVHGSVDTDVPPEYSDFAAEALPNAELVTLDGGTHICFYTHPDAEATQARAIEFLGHG